MAFKFSQTWYNFIENRHALEIDDAINWTHHPGMREGRYFEGAGENDGTMGVGTGVIFPHTPDMWKHSGTTVVGEGVAWVSFASTSNLDGDNRDVHITQNVQSLDRSITNVTASSVGTTATALDINYDTANVATGIGDGAAKLNTASGLPMFFASYEQANADDTQLFGVKYKFEYLVDVDWTDANQIYTVSGTATLSEV